MLSLSLKHALRLPSLLCLHKLSVNGFQRRTFPNCPRASSTVTLVEITNLLN
jgi:hypothetical protein